MSGAVQYDRVGPVAWVTIERPEARNAINAEVREGLFAAAARFNDDDAAVLVLTGSGEVAFCAGADLKEMSALALEVPPPEFLPVFGRSIRVDKPTIAAVNGVAYAGGFLLSQMCDLCVAADHARFAITEVKVGRGAPWAAPLPWLVPPRVAMELLITGEPLTAARAFDVGLVNRVVPMSGLHDAAQQLGEVIASNAPLSVAAAKRTVYLSMAAAYDDADKLWDPVYRSEDAQEGPRAFAEKRPPVWKGR